jgi:hypothetical protein
MLATKYRPLIDFPTYAVGNIPDLGAGISTGFRVAWGP